MTIHAPIEPNRRRGGAPVGYLDELPAVEAITVRYLRRYFSGEDGRRLIDAELCAALGPDEGRRAGDCFAELCEIALSHGRRPLLHHHPRCKVLGADESVFANFIAAAAEGEREDAILFASLLVRADVAFHLLTLAEDAGLSIRRMHIRLGCGFLAEKPAHRTLQ
ncbi:MAG: hypothetical protein WD969_12235 [Paracoccaceae bacterium]